MPEEGKQKVGPLSRTQWLIAGLAVGALVFLWYKRRQSQSAGTTDTTGIGTLPSAMPSGAMSATTNVGPSTAGQSFTSLEDWSTQVQRWANSLGFDPASVQNALQNYQMGQCLPDNQYSILNQALGLFGQPPNAPTTGLVHCQASAGSGTTTPAPTASLVSYIAGLGSAHGPGNQYFFDLNQWDVTHGIPQGSIPIYGDPSGGPPVGAISNGQTVTPTGAPKQGFGGTLFYPVAGGWVSSLDLGIKAPA